MAVQKTINEGISSNVFCYPIVPTDSFLRLVFIAATHFWTEDLR